MKVIQELATLYSALLLLTGESGEVGDLSRSISAKQIITGTLNLHLSVNMQNVRLNTSMWWWFTKINWDESVMILGIITKVQLFIFEFTAHFSVKQWGNITFTFESESVVLFCFSRGKGGGGRVEKAGCVPSGNFLLRSYNPPKSLPPPPPLVYAKFLSKSKTTQIFHFSSTIDNRPMQMMISSWLYSFPFFFIAKF